MKKNSIFIVFATFAMLPTLSFAQETPTTAELLKRIEKLEAEKAKPKDWDVSFYGWVRTEYSFDSRQSACSREYHLNLYPLDEKLDANGKDINAAGSSNFLG